MKVELESEALPEFRIWDLPVDRAAKGLTPGSFKLVIRARDDNWITILQGDGPSSVSTTNTSDVRTFNGSYEILPKGTVIKITV